MRLWVQDPLGACVTSYKKNYNALCLVLLYAFNRWLMSYSLPFEPFSFPFWKVDPCGAQEKVMEIASSLGLSVSIAVAHETFVTESGTLSCIRER